MAGKGKANIAPRIENRRAYHDYHIDAKLECGMMLLGSEVKSLRAGKAQLTDAFARVDKDNTLTLCNAHIDPYDKSGLMNHEPRRERKLLAHKREIKKLAGAMADRGTTLVPLAIYFKGSRAKVEIGVAKGKQQFDKRATIKKKEMDRELRRAMSPRT